MRVLFATGSDKSIFLSSVPLAWALRTAGHEVRVACPPSNTDVVTGAGLTVVPVGRDRMNFWHAAEVERDQEQDSEPGDAADLIRPYDVAEAPGKATWRYLTDGYRETALDWHRADTIPVAAGLVAFAQHWRPDLVLWEAISYAGPIAAMACGAAHGRLLWGLDVFGVTRDHYLRLRDQQPPEDRADPLGDWLTRYAAKYDFEFTEDMVTGQFTIDQLPGSLHTPAGLRYVPMRYIPYGGPATVPKWLTVAPERPRVAVTLGITDVAERSAGYATGLTEILDALSDLDIEVIATIADSHRHKLGDLPGNVRIFPHVPLDALAPTCAAVIHHAGFGTLTTTSSYGVPQLALPVEFDEPALANNLAGQGAGLTIPAGQVSGQAVRENLLRVLHEPSFRRQAGRLRDEMRAMPSPGEVVTQLEDLAATVTV
jgi:glycosyltransferase (activator-dependent family)